MKKEPPHRVEPEEARYLERYRNDRFVTFRITTARALGCTNAATFFHHVLYWCAKKDYRRFFKFAAPCSHDLYRAGDSWQEEFAWGRRELEAARAKVATRLGGEITIETLLAQSEATFDEAGRMTNAPYLIAYWIDKAGLTWYQPNWALLFSALKSIYPTAHAEEDLMDERCGGDGDKVRSPMDERYGGDGEKVRSPYTKGLHRDNKGTTVAPAPLQAESPPPADLTAREKEILSLLRDVPGYPFNYGVDLPFVRGLVLEFVNLDILAQVKRWQAYKLGQPLTKKSNARLQLRNWMENSERFRKERGEPPARPKAARTVVDPFYNGY